MKDEKEKAIIDQFPYMFEYQNNKTPLYPISFGFEHEDGWYNLVGTLIQQISEHDPEKIVRISQIKEKFAGLRFYIDYSQPKLLPEKEDNIVEDKDADDDNPVMTLRPPIEKTDTKVIDGLIDYAEALSYKTCEKCGSPGFVWHNKGWLCAVCGECMRDRLAIDILDNKKYKYSIYTKNEDGIKDKINNIIRYNVDAIIAGGNVNIDLFPYILEYLLVGEVYIDIQTLRIVEPNELRVYENDIIYDYNGTYLSGLKDKYISLVHNAGKVTLRGIGYIKNQYFQKTEDQEAHWEYIINPEFNQLDFAEKFLKGNIQCYF